MVVIGHVTSDTHIMSHNITIMRNRPESFTISQTPCLDPRVQSNYSTLAISVLILGVIQFDKSP